jgi:hypothetical protein
VSVFQGTNIAATTAAVTNRIVTTANMKVGAYTIANASPAWQGGALITLTHTTVATTDTLGTVALVGKGLHGEAVTETLTPSADATVTSTKVFRSVTSATGAGWVKQGATEDTIVIGVAAGSYAAVGGGTFHGIAVNTTAAAAVTVSDSGGTIATLKSSIAEGVYIFDVPFSGFLKIATTSTNDVTAIHTPGVPTTYAMA